MVLNAGQPEEQHECRSHRIVSGVEYCEVQLDLTMDLRDLIDLPTLNLPTYEW